MAGKGKQKGSAFERLVCVKLSLWATDFQRKDIFWRSAMSGGRYTELATREGVKVMAHAGDIVATDAVGAPLCERFVIECKNWRTLEWHAIMYRDTAIMVAWKKVRREAYGTRRRPLLICQENNRPMLALLDTCGYNLLASILRPGTGLRKLLVLPNEDCILIRCDQIFTNVPYPDLARLPNAWNAHNRRPTLHRSA